MVLYVHRNRKMWTTTRTRYSSCGGELRRKCGDPRVHRNIMFHPLWGAQPQRVSARYVESMDGTLRASLSGTFLQTLNPLCVPSSMEDVDDTDPTGCSYPDTDPHCLYCHPWRMLVTLTLTLLCVWSSMEDVGDTDHTGCTVIHGGCWWHWPHWLYLDLWCQYEHFATDIICLIYGVVQCRPIPGPIAPPDCR